MATQRPRHGWLRPRHPFLSLLYLFIFCIISIVPIMIMSSAIIGCTSATAPRVESSSEIFLLSDGQAILLFDFLPHFFFNPYPLANFIRR